MDIQSIITSPIAPIIIIVPRVVPSKLLLIKMKIKVGLILRIIKGSTKAKR